MTDLYIDEGLIETLHSPQELDSIKLSKIVDNWWKFHLKEFQRGDRLIKFLSGKRFGKLCTFPKTYPKTFYTYTCGQCKTSIKLSSIRSGQRKLDLCYLKITLFHLYLLLKIKTLDSILIDIMSPKWSIVVPLSLVKKCSLVVSLVCTDLQSK